jgi:hypothetical protein
MCYQGLRDGNWATGATSAPKTGKKSGECDHDAVQVAVEGKFLCCGAKQNYHYFAKMYSPKDYDEKLAVYGQELCGAPTLACHVLCYQRK